MNHFQEYLVDEFVEDYSEGRLSRRDALKLIASVAGSVVFANALLAACAPGPDAPPTPDAGRIVGSGAVTDIVPTRPGTATPEPTDTPPTATAPAAATASPLPVSGTVSPGDPAVSADAVEFDSEGAAVTGYLAQPSAAGAYPVVLVCHENRGLTDHIRDVTRRFAKAGYVALAVDLLSRLGGTDAVGSGGVPGALDNTPPAQFVADFRSGWRYLQGQPSAVAERVGMTGYCFGGGVTWLLATQMPELKAAVPFYGPHPPEATVPDIQAAVLAIYAERDQRINQGIAAIEAAMQQHGKIYEKVIYPDADHAFHNDTGSRYSAAASQDAWARTLAWLAKYV